uniref:Uncharacterized protein n=1 Tax=Sphaerodactylus townsendi TaxID=933632 RepID=A0ACB8EGK0_9SAUR
MSDQCILQHLSFVSEKKMGQGTEHRGDEFIEYVACDKAKKDYQVLSRNNLNRTKSLVIILFFLLVVIVLGILLAVFRF